ncbi:MAG: carboxypeptidase regulatory-like domain-containing protein, partial [Verrucomicrobiota bacterium]
MNLDCFLGVRVLAVLWLVLACQGAVWAQDTGTIAGRVTDSWNNNSLQGVVVTVRGTTLAVQTDAAGNYAVTGVPPGTYNVAFNKSGYARYSISDLRIAAGQTTRAEVQLKPEFFTLETFEAIAEPLTEQAVEILFDRQQSVVMVEAIGSDQISRLGASDVGDIVSKTTGATIVDGKFAVIRGLDERYTSATLNGGEIPSADPYRKSAQLDLFPSELIESVTISKTFTPDQPGGFTGGAINIVTKSFPEKFLFNFSAGTSYNEKATFNPNFSSYTGGDTDFLGIDDGTRALPEAIANTTVPRPGANDAKLYQLTRSFTTTQFGPVKSGAPLNSNFAASIGDKIKLAGRDFGYFATLSYNRKFSFYDDGVQARYVPLGAGIQENLNTVDDRSIEEVTWGAAVNLAYRLHENHELSFVFLHTQTSEKEARRISGFNIKQDEAGDVFDSTVLRFTERQLDAYQLKGKHHIPTFLDMQTDWLISVSSTSQEDPDLRFMSKFNRASGFYGFANTVFPTTPTRYFRLL